MLLETVSTSNVAAGERLAYWNDMASKMIAPVEVEPRNPSGFSAQMHRRKLRDCELLSLSSSPAYVRSAPDHASAGVLNIQLQHLGSTTNYTGGRKAVLNEGDFVLFDPSQPVWLDFEQPDPGHHRSSAQAGG